MSSGAVAPSRARELKYVPRPLQGDQGMSRPHGRVS